MKAAWWTIGAVALVGSLASPPAARAETRVGIGIQFGSRGGAYRDTYRVGYERGYSEGADDGYKDGRKGHRFELWREGDYRDADEGFKRWMGPREVYSSGFRAGFERAYRQSFARGRSECRGYRHDDGRYDGRYGYQDDDRYRYDRRYRDRDDEIIYEEPR